MWAAKSAEPEEPAGDALARMITRDISACKRLQELEDVYNEWGSSFNFIHVAAAMVECAKLSRKGSGNALFKRLAGQWIKVLPDAGEQGCANVLWAYARLGARDQQLWDSTREASMQLLQRHLSTGNGGDVSPQSISNVLWAFATSRKQPAAGELQLLLQAFLHPAVLQAATPQNVANTVWALSQLHQLHSWHAEVHEQTVQQLLEKQQLEKLVAGGEPQHLRARRL